MGKFVYVIQGFVFIFEFFYTLLKPERTNLSIIVILICFLGVVCCNIGIDIKNKK